MTGIGGIGGPRGPSGLDGADPTAATEVDEVARDAAIAPAGGPAAAGGIEALAAEIAAGRLGPNEAVREVIDRMVDGMLGAGAPGVTAADRDELRALLADLVANDPHLDQLIGRI